MTCTGFYRWIDKDENAHDCRNIKFEDTGKKFSSGKVIWRKIEKSGKRSNKFCAQFHPDVLVKGKWFLRVDTESVLEQYPELRIDD